MPKHIRANVCQKSDDPTKLKCGECNCCVLDGCSVCGAWEGELTTDCPGEPIAPDRREQVHMTDFDYVDGKGWVQLFGDASKHHVRPNFEPRTT